MPRSIHECIIAIGALKAVNGIFSYGDNDYFCIVCDKYCNNEKKVDMFHVHNACFNPSPPAEATPANPLQQLLGEIIVKSSHAYIELHKNDKP